MPHSVPAQLNEYPEKVKLELEFVNCFRLRKWDSSTRTDNCQMELRKKLKTTEKWRDLRNRFKEK